MIAAIIGHSDRALPFFAQCPIVTDSDRSKTAPVTGQFVEIARLNGAECPIVTDIPSWRSSLIGNWVTKVIRAYEAIKRSSPNIGHSPYGPGVRNEP